MRLTPCCGSMVNLNAGECRYAGERVKVNLERMRDKITFNSTMANCWPTQVRIPIPKCIYACGILQAPRIPLANLSGLNRWASGPQTSGFWCRNGTGIQITTFFGTMMSLNFMSSDPCLATNAPTGYSLNVSWITIVNWNKDEVRLRCHFPSRVQKNQQLYIYK